MGDDGLALRAATFTQLVVQDVDRPALADVDTHHLVKVLRVRDGASISVTDGRGKWALAVWSGGSLERVSNVHEGRAPRELAVGFCPLKGDRTELAVQKATELGAQRILLVTDAEHGAVRWDEQRRAKNLDRLQRIAREAVMQSRRIWMPSVAYTSFRSAIDDGATVAHFGAAPLDESHRFVLVGPEGGWSSFELGLSASKADLSSGVLRAETAVIAAVALMAAN